MQRSKRGRRVGSRERPETFCIGEVAKSLELPKIWQLGKRWKYNFQALETDSYKCMLCITNGCM